MTEQQYIFFDLGWTLEDETESQIDRAKKACAALKEFGVETTLQEFLSRQEEGARKMVPSVFNFAISSYGIPKDDVKTVSNLSPWDKSFLRLYDDAIDVLRILKQSNFLGIIANQSPGTEERLRRYQIREMFDLVFASAELGLSKPDPQIFQKAQEAAGCSDGSAWMVGDRIDNDVRPAKSSGWRTVRILNGYNRLQEPTNEGDIPDFTVERLSEVLHIIGSQE